MKALPLQTSARRRARGAPAGDTPSWFTELGWWLELEQELLRTRLIRAPFNLDPCGHLEAPVSREILRRGGRIYTERDNGLVQPWPSGSVVWANPPFRAEHMERWGPLLRVRGHDPALKVVAHVPAWTDRDWWHESIEEDRESGRAWLKFDKGRRHYGWPGNPWGIDSDSAMVPTFTSVWR